MYLPSGPGLGSGPRRVMSMQYWELGGGTRIGNVRACAPSAGTPASLMLRLGSGEMTVRAEKLTRLPDRFERKRPSLPFRRCEIVLRGRPERWRAGGMQIGRASCRE